MTIQQQLYEYDQPLSTICYICSVCFEKVPRARKVDVDRRSRRIKKSPGTKGRRTETEENASSFRPFAWFCRGDTGIYGGRQVSSLRGLDENQ